MTRRLLSAGEVVVDLVLSVPALPRRGGDVVATGVMTETGGAFNVMAAAARQGVPVTYAGLLGTGPMAALARAALAGDGIEVVLPARPDADTGTVVALVEPGGERTFVTTLGAEAQLSGADLAAVPVRPDDIVHVSGYGLAYPGNGPTVAAWVTTLPERVTVLLDPGPLVAEIPPSLLARVLDRCDWVSCNLTEARALLDDNDGDDDGDDRGDDRGDPLVMAQRMSGVVGCGVVVRLGERGAVVATGDGPAGHVPAVAVRAVDLNGAGDAHVGSFIASMATHGPAFDPVAALGRANLAAAMAVSRRGPATAPTGSQIDAGLDAVPPSGGPAGV